MKLFTVVPFHDTHLKCPSLQAKGFRDYCNWSNSYSHRCWQYQYSESPSCHWKYARFVHYNPPQDHCPGIHWRSRFFLYDAG